jgi:hypothetical protein
MKTQLTSKDIKQKIIGKTFYGKHSPNFEYIIAINSDGTLEGINNCNHYDWGKWQLNEEQHTLTVMWQNGWQNTTSNVHKKEGVTQMIDANTGQLNTRLNHEIEPIKNIQAYHFEKA